MKRMMEGRGRVKRRGSRGAWYGKGDERMSRRESDGRGTREGGEGGGGEKREERG